MYAGCLFRGIQFLRGRAVKLVVCSSQVWFPPRMHYLFIFSSDKPNLHQYKSCKFFQEISLLTDDYYVL